MAVINNLKVNTAMIENLAVEEGNIAAKAITNSDHKSGSATIVTGNWATACELEISSPSGNPVMLYYTVNVTASSGAGIPSTQYRITRNGTPIRANPNGGSSLSGSELLMDPAGVGTHTYRVEGYRSGGTNGGVSGSLIAQCNKK